MYLSRCLLLQFFLSTSCSVGNMALSRLNNLSILRRILPSHAATIYLRDSRRLINTSSKKRDIVQDQASNSKSAQAVEVPKKWVSWGFDYENFEKDRFYAHYTFFVTISWVLCTSAFIMAYYPDWGEKDWAQREAYLRLRQREQLGLPPIDPDFVPRSQIRLPTEEELGDYEIII